MITVQRNNELLHGLKAPERSLVLLMADDDRMGGAHQYESNNKEASGSWKLLRSRSSAFSAVPPRSSMSF